MKNNPTNYTDKCLFLIAEKGKWGVKDHLKPFNPVYNGAGWYVEEKHRGALEQISFKAGMKLTEWPLHGRSFDDLRRENKKDYFHTEKIKLNLLMDSLKVDLHLAHIEVDQLKNDEYRAKLKDLPKGKMLLDNIDEYDHLVEQVQRMEAEEKIAQISVSAFRIMPIAERLDFHKKEVAKYRGKKLLGLRVSTIKEFNDEMLGLRKLILLAAGPNVGKTALTIQLAIEALEEDKDICLLYLSLEMTAEDIFTRIILYLSELTFKTYMLGSQQITKSEDHYNVFTADENRRISESYKKIEAIGDRLQIIHLDDCQTFSAETAIRFVDETKAKTGCSRAMVVVDYLQMWPMPEDKKSLSDNEADKYRIGQLKKIRDELNKVNQDPVIVISEARKPSGKGDEWGGDLADVMGSARGTYTPDAVLLLSPLDDETLMTLWKQKMMPEIRNIKEFLSSKGISICRLKLPKGRDGMDRFQTDLAFHYRKNKFTTIDWSTLRREAADALEQQKK